MAEIGRYLRERTLAGVGRFSRSIWFHGSSRDSFGAAEKLIRELRARISDHQLIFTTAQPAALEWLAARFPFDTVLPAPWNATVFANRFLRRLSPRLLVLLESANGLGAAVLRSIAKLGVPIVAVNVRDDLNLEPALICAQDEAVAAVLAARGSVCTTGGLNFDFAPPAAAATAEYLCRELDLPAGVPVVAAENVPPGEEELLIDLLRALRATYPDLILLMEPASRAQASRIRSLVQERNLIAGLRSEPGPVRDAAVMIFDVPGEAQSVYSVASCVLAGGSFSGLGDVSNLAGAVACGKPIIYGPHLSPQAWLARLLLKNGAALQAPLDRLPSVIADLLRSPLRLGAIEAQATELLRQHQSATARTLRALEPFLPSPPKEPLAKHSWRVLTFRERFGESAIWNRCSRVLTRRRIDGWSALRARLGHPRTILCLGNGPSSEHPELRTLAFDCLMRVNWRWKQRGLLTEPHVVFVGDLRTLGEVSGCVFGFWSMRQEASALLRHLMLKGFRQPEYFTIERITREREDAHETRPSNGAIMILAAAALQPERLIIAGLDLFLHPNGRYPGDLRTSNEYAQVHTQNCDVDTIRRALEGYRGETVILSEILRGALQGK